VVLVDVALPTVYGFEICDRIRNTPALSNVKTILLASIYDKTRYKREPKALYGADDYIEKHHIPDCLAAKICSLVYGQSALDQAGECSDGKVGGNEAAGEEIPDRELEEKNALCEDLRKDEELQTRVNAEQAEPESVVKARRLARIIVTDIALYNQKKVEDGIMNGTFYDLLADDIQEGRRLYNERFPEDIREGTSYLEEAFEEFISRKKRELADERSGVQ
jgi:response regulator RpfG family c-di-GMP phosphodiesterase